MTLFRRVTCPALGKEGGERFGAYWAQAHLLLSGVEFTPQWHWSLRLFLNVLNKVLPQSLGLASSWLKHSLASALISSGLPSNATIAARLAITAR